MHTSNLPYFYMQLLHHVAVNFFCKPLCANFMSNSCPFAVQNDGRGRLSCAGGHTKGSIYMRTGLKQACNKPAAKVGNLFF